MVTLKAWPVAEGWHRDGSTESCGLGAWELPLEGGHKLMRMEDIFQVAPQVSL